MDSLTPSSLRVEDIREKLKTLEQQRIKVRANMGRSRVVDRMGMLEGVHPSLFVVETEERRGRVERQSFQYVDVLTGAVELFDADTGERLFDCVVEEF